MTREQLIKRIKETNNCLCIGLDTDINRLPSHFKKDAASVLEFNKKIIDATQNHCVAYKINTAFYESMGAEGWHVLEKTAEYLPEGHLKIADAKRGDIGNTSAQYAKAFFEAMPFDAVTVAPYMGKDSIEPFLQFQGKWTIVLGLTSNPGSYDFQRRVAGNTQLWQDVLEQTSQYGNKGNTMYVVGATRSEDMKEVRKTVPDHFLLVPGIGAQGGSIEDVIVNGRNDDVGLLINVSRSVIFAGNGKDFAEKAGEAALRYHNEIKTYL